MDDVFSDVRMCTQCGHLEGEQDYLNSPECLKRGHDFISVREFLAQCESVTWMIDEFLKP